MWKICWNAIISNTLKLTLLTGSKRFLIIKNDFTITIITIYWCLRLHLSEPNFPSTFFPHKFLIELPIVMGRKLGKWKSEFITSTTLPTTLRKLVHKFEAELYFWKSFTFSKPNWHTAGSFSKGMWDHKKLKMPMAILLF